MSRRNTTLPFAVVLALLGSGGVYAESDATARGDPVWEADAPMAAATTCLPSGAPEMQQQFNLGGGWDGPFESKNRFLAVTAGDPGQLQTIRVTWGTMPNWPGGHSALEGQQKWLLQPFQMCENSSQIHGPPCAPSPGQPQRWFWAARLSCDESLSWYGDLSDLSSYCRRGGEACVVDADCAINTCGVDGVIHIFDQGIVPSGRNFPQPHISANYAVQVLDSTCSSAVSSNFSEPLLIENPLFGDSMDYNSTCPTGPPNNNADISDVLGGLRKFMNAPCAPKKTRVDLEPGSPNFNVGIVDVLQAIRGFSGQPYSFPAGDACPASREP